MVRHTVYLLVLFLTCVCAAPVPDKAKVSLIRNSTIGVALGAGESKIVGVFEGNRNFNIEFVREVAEKRPDFSLVEGVNAGAAFAIDKSISIGVIKNNFFSGKNPFGG